MRARLARIEKQMRVYKVEMDEAQLIRQRIAEGKARVEMFRERQAQQEQQAGQQQPEGTLHGNPLARSTANN
jgi:hypothetical protein